MKPSRAAYGAEASPRRFAARILAWAAVAAMAAFIFWMSAKDGTTLDTGSGLVSRAKAWLAAYLSGIAGAPVDVSPLGHFFEYLVFGGLLANALRYEMPRARAAWTAPLAASLYGISDEIHQIFVPLRACDPADWAVDTVAAILGSAAVIAWLVGRSRRRGAQDPHS